MYAYHVNNYIYDTAMKDYLRFENSFSIICKNSAFETILKNHGFTKIINYENNSDIDSYALFKKVVLVGFEDYKPELFKVAEQLRLFGCDVRINSSMAEELETENILKTKQYLLITKSTEYFAYLLDPIFDKYPSLNLSEKKDALQCALDIIKGIQGIDREMYIKELSEITGISSDAFIANFMLDDLPF